jgi:ribosome maturation factor RimP
MELTEKIAQILEEKFSLDETFNDCFIVEIELKPGNNLFVYMDCDGALDFAKCQRISRYLESHLDANGWLTDKYVLEVSSPGLMRPFKFTRQYIKNIGREVTVTLLDKTTQSGLLKLADEEKITLEFEAIILEGKKKKKVMQTTDFFYPNILKTLVKIIF